MNRPASAAAVILVQNFQKTLPLKTVSAENTIRHILKCCRVSRADLTVVFVSRQKIVALNKKFLGRAYATDVLAFDLREDHKGVLRGDIIISTDAVLKQSRQFGQSRSRELTLYMIHGILHLLGYDDHSLKDIVRMRAEEQRILKLLGHKIDRLL